MFHKNCLVLAAAVLVSGLVFAEDWPHWRGPTRDGNQPRDRPSHRVEPDSKRHLAHPHARPQRIHTDPLG